MHIGPALSEACFLVAAVSDFVCRAAERFRAYGASRAKVSLAAVAGCAIRVSTETRCSW